MDKHTTLLMLDNGDSKTYPGVVMVREGAIEVVDYDMERGKLLSVVVVPLHSLRWAKTSIQE